MNAQEIRWIRPAFGLLCLQYLAAISIGLQIGFSYQMPFRSFAIAGATVAGAGLAAATVWQLFLLWREGEPHPSRRILGRLPWSLAVGVMLVACQGAVLQWMKVMLPLVSGFWADPLFASLDYLIFGQDPWRLSHSLLGGLTPLIDWIYASWVPVKLIFLFAVFFLPPSTRKTQALIAYFLTMACGVLGQYLGASAGPIFYERLDLGDRFAGLPISPWVTISSDYLWSAYLRGGGHPGGGISAMPSMHVAIALWMALVVRGYLPRLQIIAWAYFTAIFIGSVHLGWHYAVDGIVSCVFVLFVWLAARVMATAKPRKGGQPAPSCET